MKTSPGHRRNLFVLAALLLGGILLAIWMLREARRPAEASRGATVVDTSVRESRLAPVTEASGTDAPLPQSERREVPVLHDGSGLISGVVLNREGAPIEGATCSILRGRAPLGLDTLISDPGERKAPDPEASVLSDSGGRFFLEATPGHWLLRVQAVDSFPWEEDHLRPGDFRWVRLEQGIDLVARVTSPSEEPIPEARVELLRNEYAPSPLAVAHAETDRTGTARLRVPPGHWIVAVRHADLRPHFEPLEVSPGSARIELTFVLSAGIRVFGLVSARGRAAPPTGTEVRIDSISGFQESVQLACAADGTFSTGHRFSPGQVLEVAALAPGFGEARKELDLGKLPAHEHETELSLALEHREHSAHGRVVNANGQGLASVAVFVKPLLGLPRETETQIAVGLDTRAAAEMQDEPQESFEAQWRWVSRTDSDGAFRVGGMDHRRPYSLLVVSHEHANARLWIEAADSPQAIDLGTIVLHAGARIHGVVRARDGSSVAGLVLNCVWLNRVRLQPGATFRNRRPSKLTEGFEAITTSDGLFSLGPLPEGEFFLMIGREQFGPFSLRAGEDRGPEVLEIARDPRLKQEASAAISGKMIDPDGAPVEGCFVQLFRAGSGASIDLLAATSANDEGGFRLSARPPGPFVFKAIDITAAFLERAIRFESVDDWSAGDIVLVPAPQGGAKLEGRVLGPSGDGVANVKVTLHVSPSVTSCSCVSRTLYTDERGEFDFGPLAAGAHRVVVTDPEGRFRPQDRFPAHVGSFLEIFLEE